MRWSRRPGQHYAGLDDVTQVEWKTRGHDHAPGLHEALLDHGFEPEEPESIMIGDARLLAVDVDLPDGVTLRRITEEHDVRAMAAMQDEVFGDEDSGQGDAMLRRLARGDVLELWVAEAGGRVISAGRLEPVPGTEFAGLWGGATVPEWRGKGIYRALTAARARAALDLRVHARQQRLHRVLPADPRAVRADQGLHHHALHLEEVRSHVDPTQPVRDVPRHRP